MADMRLNTEHMTSRSIRKISIESDGVISVLLTEDLGNDMQLKLIPELVMDNNNIQWRCVSNLPSFALIGSRCKTI